MSDDEILDWLSLLPLSLSPGFQSPVVSKSGVIQDLLHHAGEDKMSDKDRAACKRGLELLNERTVDTKPVECS